MKLRSILEDIYPDALAFVIALAYVGITWENDWNHIIGTILALIAAALWITSRVQLGRSFAMAAEAKELIIRGIYAKIRNPMYIFSTLMVLGIIITLGHWYLYPWVALLVILQVHRAKKEGRILEKKFGQRYADYRQRTWF